MTATVAIGLVGCPGGLVQPNAKGSPDAGKAPGITQAKPDNGGTKKIGSLTFSKVSDETAQLLAKLGQPTGANAERAQ